MHRLEVICGGVRTDLGICVPIGGSFGVEKKIPCKQFGLGKPAFILVPKERGRRGKFVPVYPEEPFAYMTKLKTAFLEVREGQAGIIVADR